MAHIGQGTTLRELQEYTAAHCVERGFDNGPLQECLLLTEEVGELAKAIRKDKHASGMTLDTNSDVGQIADEIVDILWVTTVIANLYGIDIEQAFREKEIVNHERKWT